MSTPAAPTTKVIFGMRGKMLTAFGIAFTIIFGLLAVLVIRFVTDQAQAKLTNQLRQTAIGASQTLDSAGLQRLITTLPNKTNDFPALMKDPTYAADVNDLNTVFAATGGRLPDGGITGTLDLNGARPYTYFLNPTDGKLYWLTTPAAAWNPIPELANPWRGSVEETVGPPAAAGQPKSTYDYMVDGLQGTTDQPQYSDSNGNWVSSYTPLTSTNGTKMAIGVDYYLSYVDDVRNAAIRNILPLLLTSYLLLLGLVVLVSTWLTRPLKRLTSATGKIAAGEYDIDLSTVTSTRVPDEMFVLSQSFATMVGKVRDREKNLTRQVKKLTVEIDAKKREQSVNEITDSDFFAAIAAKAGNMRLRMDELESIEDDAKPGAAKRDPIGP
jgi:methyl-accepting chemotaxis protein